MGMLYYLGSKRTRVTGYVLSCFLWYGAAKILERSVDVAVDKAAYIACSGLARSPGPEDLFREDIQRSLEDIATDAGLEDSYLK